MKAVGIGEIVAALQGAAHGIPIDAVKRSEYLLRLADTIEAHGIAYEPKGEEAIAPSDNVKQADDETHRRVDEAVRNGRIEDRRTGDKP